MRIVLGILIVVSFVLAIRHELRGKRVGLVSAEIEGNRMTLQVRPPSPTAKVAVACTRGADAVPMRGYWFGPERVRGPYEDGVALGTFYDDDFSAPCEVTVYGGDEPLSSCIDERGTVSDDECDPPVRAFPPAEPEPIDGSGGPPL
ncbi:MAG TPA: hypothetical protein VL463_32805 [Kofleriaceae bacterium]|nr:hypothetical protein [Kofleriaceae bacterium]